MNHRHCNHTPEDHERLGWSCDLWPEGGPCCGRRPPLINEHTITNDQIRGLQKWMDLTQVHANFASLDISPPVDPGFRGQVMKCRAQCANIINALNLARLL